MSFLDDYEVVVTRQGNTILRKKKMTVSIECTGEVGSGKSLILRELINFLIDRNFVVYSSCNPEHKIKAEIEKYDPTPRKS